MFCNESCTAGFSSDVRVTTADYDVTSSNTSPARFNEEGCMIVPHDRLPWNNPHQIITREVSSLVNAISFLLSFVVPPPPPPLFFFFFFFKLKMF